jgi:prevent-host-death family protein
MDNGHPDGYVGRMSEYSIATAKDTLPRLIDRMLDGEPVVITRRGRPVARVVPIEPATAPQAKVDIAWLRKIREASSTGVAPTVDAVGAMRDDYRY